MPDSAAIAISAAVFVLLTNAALFAVCRAENKRRARERRSSLGEFIDSEQPQWTAKDGD